MKLVWTARAERDVIDIVEYVKLRNAAAAAMIGTRVETTVQMLLEHPRIGRPGRRRRTRELVVTGLPYLIAYRHDEGTTEILRVMHGARRWPKRLV